MLLLLHATQGYHSFILRCWVIALVYQNKL